MAHLQLIIRAGRSRGTNTHSSPGFVPPMHCKHATQLPSGESWFYEVKHDGHRVIAVKDGPDAELFSDNGKRLDYPEAREAVRKLRARRAVIDCGLIALDPKHQPSTVMDSDRNSMTRLYAFDLLHLNGRDLTTEPIERRKERLCTLLLNSALLFSPSLNCEPEMLLAEAGRLSGTGVIAKRRGSTYQPGECTESWVTIGRGKSTLKLSPAKAPNVRGGMLSTRSGPPRF